MGHFNVLEVADILEAFNFLEESNILVIRFSKAKAMAIDNNLAFIIVLIAKECITMVVKVLHV